LRSLDASHEEGLKEEGGQKAPGSILTAILQNAAERPPCGGRRAKGRGQGLESATKKKKKLQWRQRGEKGEGPNKKQTEKTRTTLDQVQIRKSRESGREETGSEKGALKEGRRGLPENLGIWVETKEQGPRTKRTQKGELKAKNGKRLPFRLKQRNPQTSSVDKAGGEFQTYPERRADGPSRVRTRYIKKKIQTQA